MRKKLTYVLLASLLVTGSSAFAMMGDEGVSGRDFNISKSTALQLMNTDKTLEAGGHHYKVTGTVTGTAGETFKEAPEEMIRFYNGWTYNKAPTSWQYLFDLPPQFDETGSPIWGTGGDGVADLRITQVD